MVARIALTAADNRGSSLQPGERPGDHSKRIAAADHRLLRQVTAGDRRTLDPGDARARPRRGPRPAVDRGGGLRPGHGGKVDPQGGTARPGRHGHSERVSERARQAARRPDAARPAADAAWRLRTTSFPSGHAASAAAFATGVALEVPALAVPVGGLAAAVGASRAISRVHYPSDVLAGLRARRRRGAGDAALVAAPPGRARRRGAAAARRPASPDGAGLILIVNSSAGTASRRARRSLGAEPARGRDHHRNRR